jgi:hypothetical protein
VTEAFTFPKGVYVVSGTYEGEMNFIVPYRLTGGLPGK